MGVALSDARSDADRRYRDALDALFARTTGGWKLGLEATRALLAELGNPHERFPSFHVAGTNGKGSTVHTIDALLRGTGLRSGRYTSPHLVDFRERIVVDGAPIPADEVTAWIERWMPAIERTGATFFEATTCLAFDWFARQAIDVGVIEVGLGGRLDATNVITPLVAGVTSIGLDHMQYLGDSIESIAREKAGIFKPDVPAAVSDRDAGVRALLSSLARDAGSQPIVDVDIERPVRDIDISAEGTTFTIDDEHGTRRLTTPLFGEFQAHNTAVALAMLELAGGEYATAAADAPAHLASVRVPGRFDRRGRYIFDVAHNADGARVLAELLRAVRPARPLRALFAVLSDKNWRGMMDALGREVDEFVLTVAPSAPPDRAWLLRQVVTYAENCGWPARSDADFSRALSLASSGRGTTLVTGSFHTVGDAMALLQYDPVAG